MKAAVLFCHSDEQELNKVVGKELGRQYAQLCQYANEHNFELEQVFFHVGQLDYEHPDDVLLLFCVDCKIADRTLLSRKREITSQRVK